MGKVQYIVWSLLQGLRLRVLHNLLLRLYKPLHLRFWIFGDGPQLKNVSLSGGGQCGWRMIIPLPQLAEHYNPNRWLFYSII